MALTEREKHRTIFYLGWSGLTLVEDSTQFNSVVNDRLGTIVKPLNDEIERIVRGLLEKLAACDEQLESAKCRLAASRVDNIEMNPRELEMIRKERLKCIRELSDHLAIPIMRQGGVNTAVVC